MARRHSEHPLRVERIVETERRAGVDLAWIVALGVVVCVVAIAWAVPDRVITTVSDTSGLNVNGVVGLIVAVPLGATVFAWRRYRDAVGAQKELTHLALHDATTGLPNRRHLRELLPDVFRHARRHNARAAVMFIDLDGFKAVNDTYGYEVGDVLMAAVGERIRRDAGSDRLVARYAGDEFVLVDPEPTTQESAVRHAAAVVDLIEQPFQIGEDRISISASIGVAFGEDESDPDLVIRDADTAMYEAKYSGQPALAFDESMRARLTPATAERRLSDALDNGEFRLLHQPIVALAGGRVIGAEAMLRWDDPRRGLVHPGDFLPALEDTGLIVPVGRWILEEACRQAHRWADLTPAGVTPLRVTLDVTSRQLVQSDFLDDLTRAVDAAGVDPRLLYLQVTEAALLADVRTAWRTIAAVREIGVGLALDGFGSGHASLNNLRDFDLELLKFDVGLVTGLATRSENAVMMRHTIALARELGVATLAEGIDDAGTVERLVALGCELGQGRYFAEPVAASVVDSLVEHADAMAGATRSAMPEPEAASDDVGTVVLPTLRRTVEPVAIAT